MKPKRKKGSAPPSWVRAMRLAVRRAARDVTFVHAGIPTRVTTSAHAFHVHIHTQNRDTGEHCDIQLSWRWDGMSLRDAQIANSRDGAIEWIYRRALEAWEHELNEAMHVSGERRRDLHDEHGRTVQPPYLGIT